jgi:nucleotide-binding universal stress UspA family protein
VVHPVSETRKGRGAGTRETVDRAGGVLDELEFRIRRLDVEVASCTAVAEDAAEAILGEIRNGSYDLVVMGGIDRGRDGRIYLGHTIHTVLQEIKIPSVLLLTHEQLVAE